MTFFTVLFIGYFLYALSKGNVLYDSLIKVGEANISYKEGKITEKEFTTQTIKMLLLLIPMLILLSIQFTYLVIALSIDPYKYPTIFMILWIILSLIVSGKRPKKQPKPQDDIETYHKNLYIVTRKRTLKGTVYQLISLAYFCFMFYILVLQQ